MRGIYNVTINGMDAWFNDDAKRLFDAALGGDTTALQAIETAISDEIVVKASESIVKIQRVTNPNPNDLYDMLDAAMAKLQELDMANKELYKTNEELFAVAEKQHRTIQIIQGKGDKMAAFGTA